MTHLTPSLEELEAAQLIRPLADPERAYFFRHILVQESAYDTLLKHERRALHRAIALALEILDRTPAEELARHFAAAEMPERAAHYYTLAAQRTKSRFENSEAITFFRLALDEQAKLLSPSPHAQIELYEGLGDVLAMTGKSEQALGAYDAALAGAEECLTRARLTRKQGDVHQLLLDYETTRLTYDRALSELGRLNESLSPEHWHEWILIMVGAMNNNYWHGHWEQVRALIDEASPAVASHGTPMLRAMYLDRVEMMHARRNRYVMDDMTRDLVVQMHDAANESGDPIQILNARFSMAFVELRRRNLDDAETEFLWSIENARELGAVMYLLWAMTYLAVLYRWRGDSERVRELVEGAQKLEGAKNTPWYAAGLANLAWIALREHRTAEARQYAEAAMRMWEPFGELYPFKTLALFPLLELARRDMNSAQATHYLQEIQKPSQEKLDDALDASLMRAQDALAVGNFEVAYVELDRALAMARREGFV